MQLQGKLQMIADSMASRSEPIRRAQDGIITFVASGREVSIKKIHYAVETNIN